MIINDQNSTFTFLCALPLIISHYTAHEEYIHDFDLHDFDFLESFSIAK
jgi:hypothetical protein